MTINLRRRVRVVGASSPHVSAPRALAAAHGCLAPTPYTLHPTPNSLHPTPYTLHLTPYSLHPTPCTLKPTPYALHHKQVSPYLSRRGDLSGVELLSWYHRQVLLPPSIRLSLSPSLLLSLSSSLPLSLYPSIPPSLSLSHTDIHTRTLSRLPTSTMYLSHL